MAKNTVAPFFPGHGVCETAIFLSVHQIPTAARYMNRLIKQTRTSTTMDYRLKLLSCFEDSIFRLVFSSIYLALLSLSQQSTSPPNTTHHHMQCHYYQSQFKCHHSPQCHYYQTQFKCHHSPQCHYYQSQFKCHHSPQCHYYQSQFNCHQIPSKLVTANNTA